MVFIDDASYSDECSDGPGEPPTEVTWEPAEKPTGRGGNAATNHLKLGVFAEADSTGWKVRENACW